MSEPSLDSYSQGESSIFHNENLNVFQIMEFSSDDKKPTGKNREEESNWQKNYHFENFDDSAERKRLAVKSFDDLLNLSQRNSDLEKEIFKVKAQRDNDKRLYEKNTNDLREQIYKKDLWNQELKAKTSQLETRVRMLEEMLTQEKDAQQELRKTIQSITDLNQKFTEDNLKLKVSKLEDSESINSLRNDNLFLNQKIALFEKRNVDNQAKIKELKDTILLKDATLTEQEHIVRELDLFKGNLLHSSSVLRLDESDMTQALIYIQNNDFLNLMQRLYLNNSELKMQIFEKDCIIKELNEIRVKNSTLEEKISFLDKEQESKSKIIEGLIQKNMEFNEKLLILKDSVKESPEALSKLPVATQSVGATIITGSE